MNFKILALCFIAFASVKAGFLNVGQSGTSPGGSGGNGGTGGSFGFQQVPLTLTPGPAPQSQQGTAPHAAAAITASFAAPVSSQPQGSFSSPGPAATSSTYRQQHVNSVPATITTHGVATSYVAVPAHGFFGGSAGTGGNAGSNGGSGGNSGSSSGTSGGGYGFGGYGYSFSAAGGNTASSGGNQGGNSGSYPYNFGGNGGTPGTTGYSG